MIGAREPCFRLVPGLGSSCGRAQADVLVANDGANSVVREHPAVSALLPTRALKFPAVFGLVANLQVPARWNRVSAYDAAKQFEPELFRKIAEASGLRLENFVFYPGASGTAKE